MVLSFLLLPKVGFHPQGGEVFMLPTNLFFPFVHANIFHLLCNILCLWQMTALKRMLPIGFIISLACSYLPESAFDIMGCSGVIFAIIGYKFGEVAMFRKMIKSYALFFIITAFIPNVAVLFHLYCLIVAYLLGNIIQTFMLWRKAYRI